MASSSSSRSSSFHFRRNNNNNSWRNNNNNNNRSSNSNNNNNNRSSNNNNYNRNHNERKRDDSNHIAGKHFSESEWLWQFEENSEKRNFQKVRNLRLDILDETVIASRNRAYFAGEELVTFPKKEEGEDNVFVNNYYDFDKPENTRPGEKITPLTIPPIPKDPVLASIKTIIEVVNNDCLQAAIDLHNEGFNPLVLNMASDRRPGGGYLSGAGAQEENLFRRSNYFQFIDTMEMKKYYPLPEFGCIYSKDVLVFRGPESDGYPFLSTPIPFSFIAMPAYRSPPLQYGRLSPVIAEGTKLKMHAICNVAIENGHDSLLLSAMGCGAFRNPPAHVAVLFAEVLKHYDGIFRRVVFAILNDHNSRHNYEAFRDEFHPSQQRSGPRS